MVKICQVQGDLASRLVRAFSTVSKGTLPFSDPLAPRSKSIQPSLKPSSICRRGVGFFIPCALNNFSLDSRGTTSMRKLQRRMKNWTGSTLAKNSSA